MQIAEVGSNPSTLEMFIDRSLHSGRAREFISVNDFHRYFFMEACACRFTVLVIKKSMMVVMLLTFNV